MKLGEKGKEGLNVKAIVEENWHWYNCRNHQSSLFPTRLDGWVTIYTSTQNTSIFVLYASPGIYCRRGWRWWNGSVLLLILYRNRRVLSDFDMYKYARKLYNNGSFVCWIYPIPFLSGTVWFRIQCMICPKLFKAKVYWLSWFMGYFEVFTLFCSTVLVALT